MRPEKKEKKHFLRPRCKIAVKNNATSKRISAQCVASYVILTVKEKLKALAS